MSSSLRARCRCVRAKATREGYARKLRAKVTRVRGYVTCRDCLPDSCLCQPWFSLCSDSFPRPQSALGSRRLVSKRRAKDFLTVKTLDPSREGLVVLSYIRPTGPLYPFSGHPPTIWDLEHAIGALRQHCVCGQRRTLPRRTKTVALVYIDCSPYHSYAQNLS